MNDAGQRLRQLREQLGLTIRDVEAASAALATQLGNPDYAISLSWISDIETKGRTPNIFRLFSLARIYRRDYRELLRWYGVDPERAADVEGVRPPPRTHLSSFEGSRESTRIPTALDPGFDPRHTSDLARMVQSWGAVPFAALEQLSNSRFLFGYLGAEDWTMYPLLPPGTFLQIDPSQTRVTAEEYRSEYERPIYFVETREGFRCAWCSLLRPDQLLLQPHPLSPVKPVLMRHPQDAEILGRVVGVAISFERRTPPPSTR